jgi:hypothetical protein
MRRLVVAGSSINHEMKFHQRFNIEVNLQEAQKRFVNRIYNRIFLSFLDRFNRDEEYRLELAIASELGDKYEFMVPISKQVGGDYERNLQAIEALFASLPMSERAKLDEIIQNLLIDSETDLGIEWDSGRFLPKGARLLDEQLVNDPLHWLRESGHQSVLDPFEKGLSHFASAKGKPELLSDVVTDMYESLEALAKVVTGRDKDLSANRELFASKVRAPDAYKDLLTTYISYANNFRHAATQQKPKPPISEQEVECFVYLTGLFIRFSMTATKDAP